MAVKELGTSPVVFGRTTELSESIVAELRRRGLVDGETAHTGAGESIIVIVDQELVSSLFADAHSSRAKRHKRTWENHTRELVTYTAIDNGAHRLLVVCDVRRTSADERERAIDWVRRLAHRIGYECSINGLHGFDTTYAVVDSDADVSRTARAVVDW